MLGHILFGLKHGWQYLLLVLFLQISLCCPDYLQVLDPNLLFDAFLITLLTNQNVHMGYFIFWNNLDK